MQIVQRLQKQQRISIKLRLTAFKMSFRGTVRVPQTETDVACDVAVTRTATVPKTI